jgi:hypothetical protein
VLSESEVREAVRRYTRSSKQPPSAEALAGAEVEWLHLLEGEVVRGIESRSESGRLQHGEVDLSGRREYTGSLAGYRLAAPKDPGIASTLRMVRAGSVEVEHCGCGTGKASCPRCRGGGDLPCEETQPCGTCRGIDSCLRCDDVAPAAAAAVETRGGVAVERVTCRRCGTTAVACPACAGRRRVTCDRCQGTGRWDCPDCDRDGTVPHERCGGRGATTTWTEGLITRTPSVTKIKSPVSGVPLGAWGEARRLGTWQRLELGADQILSVAVTGEFQRLAQEHLGRRKGEVGRRATLDYLPVARVTVPEERTWVYHVVPGKTDPQVFRLLSPRRAGQLTAVAVTLVVVALVLTRLLN